MDITENISNWRTGVAIGCLVIMVWGFDHLAGSNVLLWPFYLIPVVLAALLMDWIPATVFAILAAAMLVAVRAEHGVYPWLSGFFWLHLGLFSAGFSAVAGGVSLIHGLLKKAFSP